MDHSPTVVAQADIARPANTREAWCKRSFSLWEKDRMRGDTLKNKGRNPSPCPSQQARLGVLATPNARIRKRMRMGEGVRSRPLLGRPFSQPYPLADMATPDGKLAKASLRGEVQDEGVLGSFQLDLG